MWLPHCFLRIANAKYGYLREEIEWQHANIPGQIISKIFVHILSHKLLIYYIVSYILFSLVITWHLCFCCPMVGGMFSMSMQIISNVTQNSLLSLQILLFESVNAECDSLLEDYSNIKSEGYDLAIMDGVTYSCYYTLPYKLGIPWITFTVPFVMWLYRLVSFAICIWILSSK